MASVSAAISRIPRGASGTVVVLGGTYRQGGIRVPGDRTVRIVGAPGEQVVFDGSAALGGWTSSGATSSAPYVPRPVTDGSGITFSRGMNLTGNGVGMFADQAWSGGRQLRQVSSIGEVTNDTFFVDRGAGRLHVSPSTAAAGVEASSIPQFIAIAGAGSSIEGVTVQRYSNDPAVYGAVRVDAGASQVTFRDVLIRDAAFQAVQIAGSPSEAGLVRQVTFERVRIESAGWMGVSATLVDDLALRSVTVVGSNPFGEFTNSPQSGALKTSRARRVQVIDSVIENNNSHGLWFDQSNFDVDVVGNRVAGNAGSGVFWEISDDLTLVDNQIIAPPGGRALKIAGASGVKMLNNTIVGGQDPVGIYVDVRSMAGCADPSRPLCPNSYSSDRDTVRRLPPTLDWMPRIDVMVNNVFGLPGGVGYCGGLTVVCVTGSNGSARVDWRSVFHSGDPSRGIPASWVDGNVYVYDSSASAVRIPGSSFASPAAFAAATGFERNADAGWYVSSDGVLTGIESVSHRAVPSPAGLGIDWRVPPGSMRRGHLP